MKDAEALYIAGIQLKIQSQQLFLPVPGYENPGYRHFFSIHPVYPLTHAINVTITSDTMPDMSGMKQIFNNPDTWRVFSKSSDPSENFIVYEISSYDLPVWIAKVYNGCQDVILYCNDYIFDKEQHRLKFNPVCYPLDQILMMFFLAEHQGAIFHAAGCRFNNTGWMFAGISGAGKSTITNLINKKGNGQILSDDRIAVRKIDSQFIMFGTPWPGESGYAINQSSPLKGVFFLKQGDKNHIDELKPSEIIAQLMPVVSIPWYDRDKVGQMMEFCDLMISHIPMYQLTFKPDDVVVDMLMEFANG